MSQSGSYVEDPKTGKVTLVERTQEPPPRTAPRQPGEPVIVDPDSTASPAATPAAGETTAFTPDVKAAVSIAAPAKKAKE